MLKKLHKNRRTTFLLKDKMFCEMDKVTVNKSIQLNTNSKLKEYDRKAKFAPTKNR